MHTITDALRFAFGMTWEILWALILGFALSGAVQAVVSKQEMHRLLPDDSPRTLAVATGLGAASSGHGTDAITARNGETRTRTGDTTIFSSEAHAPRILLLAGLLPSPVGPDPPPWIVGFCGRLWGVSAAGRGTRPFPDRIVVGTSAGC
jgi:uncharacterized protein